MGVNLQQYIHSGHLTCLSPPLASLPAEPTASSPAQLTEDASGPGERLRRLWGAIRAAAQQRPAAVAGVALIVDSLTVLAALCPHPAEWRAFLHHCSSASLLEARQVPSCVVAGVCTDVPDDAPWVASLEHRAEVVVEVQPLPGRVADVDGLVTVVRRRLGAAAGHSHGHGQGEAGAGHGFDDDCLPGWRRSAYFRGGELAMKWMPQVTDRELLH